MTSGQRDAEEHVEGEGRHGRMENTSRCLSWLEVRVDKRYVRNNRRQVCDVLLRNVFKFKVSG